MSSCTVISFVSAPVRQSAGIDQASPSENDELKDAEEYTEGDAFYIDPEEAEGSTSNRDPWCDDDWIDATSYLGDGSAGCADEVQVCRSHRLGLWPGPLVGPSKACGQVIRAQLGDAASPTTAAADVKGGESCLDCDLDCGADGGESFREMERLGSKEAKEAVQIRNNPFQITCAGDPF
jgi:hypothetical protein